MISDLNNKKLVADPDRIKILEAPYRLNRERLSNTGILKKASFFFRYQSLPYYFDLPPIMRILWRSRNWQHRMLPDFQSTGSIRSGTSSLSNYILQHPCVVLPLVKEIAGNVPRLQYILAQMPTLKEKEKVEKRYDIAQTGICNPVVPSPTWPYIARAINPDMKMVVMLRNPVDRVFSHWRWNMLQCASFYSDKLWQHIPDFETSMRMEMRQLKEGSGSSGFHLFTGAVHSSYLRNSIYKPFLEVLYENFHSDQVLILNASDFFKNPIDHAKIVYAFLGLPGNYTPVEIKEHNPSPPMEFPADLRQELVEFFQPYNESLYEFLKCDFGWN